MCFFQKVMVPVPESRHASQCVAKASHVYMHHSLVKEHPLHKILVLQAWLTSAKKGKGLVNWVYKPCPTALYSAVQSHCSIVSHDPLYHWVAKAVLKTAEESYNISTAEAVKKTLQLYFLRERAYSITGNSRVEIWLHHPVNCIPVGHGLYTQFTPFFGSGSGLLDWQSSLTKQPTAAIVRWAGVVHVHTFITCQEHIRTGG